MSPSHPPRHEARRISSWIEVNWQCFLSQRHIRSTGVDGDVASVTPARLFEGGTSTPRKFIFPLSLALGLPDIEAEHIHAVFAKEKRSKGRPVTIVVSL